MARPKDLVRITVADALAGYREVLERRVARSELSANTLEPYMRDLHEFAGLVGAATIVDDIESDDIERALTRIAAAPDRRYTRGMKLAHDGAAPVGRGAHSRARWFASVKGFFRWAADQGYVQVDPMRSLRPPRTPRRAKGARLGITVDKAETLRDAPARPTAKPRTAQQNLTLRDAAILRLLTESGPRVSEVCGANREDIRVHEDTGRPVLHVVGKGSKPRDIPLSAATATAIEEYQAAERPALPPVADPHDRRERALREDAQRALFVTVRGRRMGPRDVQRMVDRLARTVGIRVTPHGLRHTALTILVRSGADIATVAQVAGHASVATTSVYMDDSAVAAADAIDASPLGGGFTEGVVSD